MSRYINRVLGPDEHVIYEAEIHWYVYLRGFFTIMFGAFLGRALPNLIDRYAGFTAMGVPGTVIHGIALAVIAIGAYSMMCAYIRQISTELVLTNRRVIAKYGFIATTTFELMITKVEGANIDQTVWGRLLGFGTILVKGTGGGISPIDHIARPYLFHDYLMKVLEKLQQRDPSSGKND